MIHPAAKVEREIAQRAKKFAALRQGQSQIDAARNIASLQPHGVERGTRILAGGVIEIETALDRQVGIARRHERSEEHTSELQSLMRIAYAVFRLKKKNRLKSQQPY